MIQDRTDPNIVYSGGKVSGDVGSMAAINISKDGGTTWAIRKNLPTNATDSNNYYSSCRCIDILRSNSKVVYAAGTDCLNAAVFRSEDAGSSWKNITNNLLNLFSGTLYITSADAILCDPRNENRLWVGTNECLCVTTDGGSVWKKTNLTRPILALAYDSIHGMYYAGTIDDGVYFSEDGLSWNPLGDDLRKSQCLCLGVNSETGALYASIDGWGIWRFSPKVGIGEWSLY